ncbi:GntR family transcriptional regulator [Corynebacterium sp. sy017]|uniref:GntR family transcriptional regulator n=1 Tax=unclassified Corynebacterium TaxID=2624378 RepID=UPI001185D9CE|nr:GntR family transcriptional regulator [Corynebacterium sp. SY003]MBP3087904.1 GntR family transcriptional regulator [Corynebacterium sp. sy017]TSD92445.1 GntR family transcriptional regulator [Corynebacterium sp. SY003]
MAKLQQHQEIAAHLRQQIRTGVFSPGQAIPSEAQLCQQFHCARGTIRQAITTLRTEGLLSSGQGRRSRVLDTVPTQSFDGVISFSQWCQNSGIEPGQQTQWVTRRPAGSELAVRLNISATDQIVSVYRLRLMDGEPAMVERLNYPLEVGKHILIFDTDSGSIYQQLINSGISIAYAIRTIDAIPAAEEDARLLGVTPGTPLLRVRRHTFSQDGTPIEASDDRYLSHMANFTMTTVRGTPSPISMVNAQNNSEDDPIND